MTSEDEINQFMDKQAKDTSGNLPQFDKESALLRAYNDLCRGQIEYLKDEAADCIHRGIQERNETIETLKYPRAGCYLFTATAFGFGALCFRENTGERLAEKQDAAKAEAQSELYLHATQTCHAQAQAEIDKTLEKAIAKTTSGQPASFVFNGEAYNQKHLTCVQATVNNAPPADVPDTSIAYVGTGALLAVGLLGAYWCRAMEKHVKEAGQERTALRVADEVRQNLLLYKKDQLQALNAA
ncbi:MAG: hypothetical protein V4621_06320 [Pseudomonadota bacterium]